MRTLRIQQLEPRMMLHADVNLDNEVTPADALAVINHLAADAEYGRNLDVNRDARVSALDALQVINRLDKPTAARTFTFSLGKIDTFGLEPDGVQWAIREALYEYEEIANLRMKIVSNGGQYSISSAPLYIGNQGFPFGSYARGQTKPGLGGHIIQFANGITPAGQHVVPYVNPDGTNVPANQAGRWHPFNQDPNNLKKILVHEIGHAAFSWQHSNNRSCIMHINSGVDDFCPAEASFLKARFK